MDARVWAREFIDMWKGTVVDEDLDFETMIGWFANAITVGEMFERRNWKTRLEKMVNSN